MELSGTLLIRGHKNTLDHNEPEGLEAFLLDILLVRLAETTIEMGC